MNRVRIFSLSATVLFGALSVLVLLGLTVGFDEAVLLWLNTHANPTLDTLFTAATRLGGVVFVSAATIGISAWLLYKKRKRAALFVSASVAGVALLHVLLKLVFERPRPDLWEWLVVETSFSFPSGHASASMALALCALFLVWRTKWRASAAVLLGTYVLVVGVSRMYLGLHFPTDIIGGWLLAVAGVCAATWILYGPHTPTKRKRP